MGTAQGAAPGGRVSRLWLMLLSFCCVVSGLVAIVPVWQLQQEAAMFLLTPGGWSSGSKSVLESRWRFRLMASMVFQPPG